MNSYTLTPKLSIESAIDNIFKKIFTDTYFVPRDYSLFKTALTHKSISSTTYMSKYGISTECATYCLLYVRNK